MSDEWRWIGPDGFEYSGSLDRLRESLDDGKLPPTTEVWRAGMDAWQEAQAVAELSDVARARAFTPLPEMKTPPPVGISADAVVMRSPQGQMQALSPPPSPVASPSTPPRARRRSWLLPVAGVGGLVLAGLLGAITVRFLRGQEPATVAPSASAPVATVSASAEPARARRCATQRTKPLSKSVLGKVPLMVSARADAGELLVGFAESRLSAHVLGVDTETLAVRSRKQQRAQAPIVAVVPLATSAGIEMAVDTADPRLRLARTVAAKPAFEIGIGSDGIARRGADGELSTLWKVEGDGQATVPRADGSAERGWLVTLRRGGLGGRVLAGWLGSDGRTRSELEAVELDAAQLGTPAAAVGPSGALLVVAARPSADAAWDIALGVSEIGKIPSRLKELATPRSSASASRMSPAAVALEDGGYALQWTERTASGHVVRAQLLDDRLDALSPPVTVSPDGAESGQGEIWAQAGRLISLYLVKSDAGHELWASSVSCN